MKIAIRFASAAVLAFSAGVRATPPGNPLSEIKARQLSLGVYFDHGGQLLFTEGSPSVLNTTGAALEYGLLDFVQLGAFAGAAEFDVDRPPGADDTVPVFDAGFGPYGGLSAKVASPRFLTGTSRFVAYSQAGALTAKDKDGNEKSGMVYNSGLTFQYELRKRMNFVVGAEYHAMDGKQKDVQGNTAPFGLNKAGGEADLVRGVLGFEYFFKGPNRPFISVAFRPTGALGYQDGFGLQGGSVSITLGAINSFGKQSDQPDEDSRTLAD